MTPIIDHIQITVKDLNTAEVFYDALLPILGYNLNLKSKGHVPANEFDVIEYVHPQLTIGINSPRSVFKDEEVHRRKPGALHHLAFQAQNESEVDQAYEKLVEASVNIVAPPQFYPQHGEHYYALFIKDPGGIKLEIVYEKK